MATLRTLPKAAALGLVAVAACSLFYTEIDSYPCPPAGTTLRYGNFGATFMDSHCQSCHGSQSIDRQGAPGEFIFDTVEQIQRHRARIFVRSAADNNSMPPGPDDPTAEERRQLAEWLACGAP
ncbi:MAG: c-type cytochrome [Myxococcales bacterium]|nr:c-type cytochrome [Myxococcales bacterium]